MLAHGSGHIVSNISALLATLFLICKMLAALHAKNLTGSHLLSSSKVFMSRLRLFGCEDIGRSLDRDKRGQVSEQVSLQTLRHGAAM